MLLPRLDHSRRGHTHTLASVSHSSDRFAQAVHFEKVEADLMHPRKSAGSDRLLMRAAEHSERRRVDAAHVRARCGLSALVATSEMRAGPHRIHGSLSHHCGGFARRSSRRDTSGNAARFRSLQRLHQRTRSLAPDGFELLRGKKEHVGIGDPSPISIVCISQQPHHLGQIHATFHERQCRRAERTDCALELALAQCSFRGLRRLQRARCARCRADAGTLVDVSDA
mmetsp:Transcript_3306/g.13380  ORF Transcript_3306/g.13380 Transcript_3306/m.13380 type:complete len:226 (-) Transcript_3306:1463-2140(-)